MLMAVNLSLIALYGFGLLLVLLGEIPWWVLVGLVIWDLPPWFRIFKIPFTKPKHPPVLQGFNEVDWAALTQRKDEEV